MVYKVVHTGPNAQLGGRHGGRSRVSYHDLIFFRVTNPPIIPPKNKRRNKCVFKNFVFT